MFVWPTAGMQLLAREGNNAGAAVQLKALVLAVERQEPSNPALWLHLAQPYARLAGQAFALLCDVHHLHILMAAWAYA